MATSASARLSALTSWAFAVCTISTNAWFRPQPRSAMSTPSGGGEIVRHIGHHGTGRVAKLVLVAAVPPMMLRTDDNPEGLPLETFNVIRAGESR
jgi:hypothetical protein